MKITVSTSFQSPKSPFDPRVVVERGEGHRQTPQPLPLQSRVHRRRPLRLVLQQVDGHLRIHYFMLHVGCVNLTESSAI